MSQGSKSTSLFVQKLRHLEIVRNSKLSPRCYNQTSLHVSYYSTYIFLGRLWEDVTYNLTHNNIEQATAAKHKLEQRQREEAKERKEKGTKWQTKVKIIFYLYVFNSVTCLVNYHKF